ncbi:hypothetical protein P3X46_010569 [Hevea brasiliensis]|uniref:Leucine-rich repeat-containing N-terminal plant-type domain-containing protein n=1 Tax=Hevea brasiliensis TaxID=3981 RepID=A0ABQ9MEH6_HEVBR|nr:hypothetical protein P3X46_010569 [Hevea brasiliensis]
MNLMSSLHTLKLKYSGLHVNFVDYIHSSTLMSLDPLDNQNLMLDTIVFNKLVQNLPNLREVDLSYVNMFLAEPISLMNLSSSLSSLQLMECGLQGEFPGKLLQRPKLRVLDLRGNDHCLPRSNWSCSLETLYLSYTKIAIHLEHDLISNLRSVKRLSLGGCNFVGSNAAFFGDLRQLHELSIPLDNFSGQIPAVFENLKHLTLLSLSSNKFSGQIPPSLANLNQLISLFLFNNNLNGTIPTSLQTWLLSLIESDLSYNLLNETIPSTLFNLPHLQLLFLNDNLHWLEGAMPSSVCKLKLAQVHDFSNNSFNDFIPHCLGRFSNDLLVLHLGMNNFHGSIRTSFSNNNSLMYLNFNGNLLERRIPSTITNCKNLEVLDIGNNKIDDTFPVFWHTLKQLQVLILQSNKLHGSLKDAIGNYSFSKLRIFDISNNSSSGPWPLEYFISLEAMIVPNQEIEYMRVGKIDLMIQTSFTIIDLSANKFIGNMSWSIGKLESLKLLSLSHNYLIGNIPPLLGKLRNLESLNVSSIMINGKILTQLVDLIFLSVFHVSHYQLEGHIPLDKQLDTFDSNSYEGNPRLCGFPLRKACENGERQLVTPLEEDSKSENGFGWKAVLIGDICSFVFGI